MLNESSGEQGEGPQHRTRCRTLPGRRDDGRAEEHDGWEADEQCIRVESRDGRLSGLAVLLHRDGDAVRERQPGTEYPVDTCLADRLATERHVRAGERLVVERRLHDDRLERKCKRGDRIDRQSEFGE